MFYREFLLDPLIHDGWVANMLVWWKTQAWGNSITIEYSPLRGKSWYLEGANGDP